MTDCIHGSTEVGKALMARAAKTLKKVSLELGGKSPNIVLADADLEAASKGALNAIFYGKGEVCAAGSRLLVEESVHDDLMNRVRERAGKMVAGDPMNPKTRLGAIVSKEQMDSVLRYIEEGKREGAKLVSGGARTDIGTGKGYFVQPHFDDVDPKMKIAREEISAGLATIRFNDVEDGIRKQRTVYGWPAVWTATSPRHIESPKHQPGRCGSTPTTSTSRAPFGASRVRLRPRSGPRRPRESPDKSVWVNLS